MSSSVPLQASSGACLQKKSCRYANPQSVTRAWSLYPHRHDPNFCFGANLCDCTEFQWDHGRWPGDVNRAARVAGTFGVSDTTVKLAAVPFLRATVPAGATTGYVTVTTPSGTLTSNAPFYVMP